MRQLSSDEARAFHRALNAEGVDAVVVAEDNLTALPKKMALQRIELTETDFVVFDQIGRPEKFPWSRILLLALGAMTVSNTGVTSGMQYLLVADSGGIVSSATSAQAIDEALHLLADTKLVDRVYSGDIVTVTKIVTNTV